jgi:hypothetical protein|tara:strand:- start:38 stop:289 length:252 start_codon:yes stop_codon:yes gene_type:complete
MKVKQALEIGKTLGYNIPNDITDDIVYYSESKKDYISVLDMDIVHLVRAFDKLKTNLNGKDYNVMEALNSIEEYIKDVRAEYE